MIASFRDRDTERIWLGLPVRRFGLDVQRQALKKLRLLDAARTLNDLRIPPNNRLEALFGDRKGQHSIRVNDQFRLCFVWKGDRAERVEIVDYH
ncbi:MAG: type II toxin-antitoxin system RelE/ParE family toxin [Alphaproteobacteria bacterium]